MEMTLHLRHCAATAGLLIAIAVTPASAEKQGGILRQYIIDSPDDASRQPGDARVPRRREAVTDPCNRASPSYNRPRNCYPHHRSTLARVRRIGRNGQAGFRHVS